MKRNISSVKCKIIHKLNKSRQGKINKLKKATLENVSTCLKIVNIKKMRKLFI